ncbi:DinB family protein [Sediminicola luteus]|uniref:DinB-like domain-containing protein n=1 Tax=Sediminicola luteus TaxID=319238 RepID=A0A2A4GB63_9FLAO|nr:DinB family protein [Sediminicola luteus]PCE66199.1 hypothetical protein B7P33_02560 [Sediminicola luteus]
MYKFLFIFICLGSQANAQTFDFAQKQLAVWEMAKKRTLAVAEAMPQTDYYYQPAQGVKSFAQQIAHMTNSLKSMHTRFILKQPYSSSEKEAGTMGKKQLVAELSAAFDMVLKDLPKLSDTQLQETGKTHGAFPLTKWQSLLFMQDHITNHRAKAVLYLRMKGIRPPQYGYN